MNITNNQYDNLIRAINTLNKNQALKIMDAIKNADTIKEISKKYKDEITLQIQDLKSKKFFDVKCIKINNVLAIGKRLYDSMYVIYHITEKIHLGIIGRKNLILNLASELNKLNINYNDVQELKRQLQNDQSDFHKLIYKYRALSK